MRSRLFCCIVGAFTEEEISGLTCWGTPLAILDADSRSFFTEVSQERVVRFLEHRISDQRIIQLIQKWLQAGILEDGVVTKEQTGTGQLFHARRFWNAMREMSLVHGSKPHHLCFV